MVIVTAALVLAAFVLGMIVSYFINRRVIKTLRARIRALREGLGEPEKPETMKRVVWACVINGFAWVWCSYILAAMGREQIADGLSKVALLEIIVPVFVYAAKSLFENFSKHNKWPDKEIAEGRETEEDTEAEEDSVG